jgi:hypothetical protein
VDTQANTRLIEVMTAMANGDRAAPFALYLEFGAAIAGAMRRHLRHLGVHAPDAADLDGLVIDACLVIADCATGWKPQGGARPWTWAEHRLRQLASRSVGQHTDALPAGDPVANGSGVADGDDGDDGDDVDLLARLAERDEACALLQEALAKVASPRDRAVVLELRVQADSGDPSPAITVGRRHNLSPDATRQVASRVRGRLRRLADDDPHFAALRAMTLVS